MKRAVIGGHLEVMKWLKEDGCPVVNYHAIFAAQDGQLEVLKWLKENGCALNALCLVCAQRGDLEMLKWLHEHGCPIGRNRNIIDEAARSC